MNIELLSEFHFLRPEMLWLLIPFAVVIYLNWNEISKQQQGLGRIPEHLRKILEIGDSKWLRNLPIKVIAIACVIAVLIIAGPSWTKQPSPFGEDKADLIVVLDTSSSMLQSDVAPSRLALAKFKLQDLLEQREGGRTALVLYSGSAHIAMPLTKDSKVFESLFAAIEPQLMPRDGKFAHYTLPLIDKLTSNDSRATTVLLVTDGLSQQAQQHIEHYFEQRTHQLIIWGMGDSDKPSGIPFESESLEELAAKAGGYYRVVSTDNKDVEQVSRRINSQLQISTESAMPWKDSGYPLTFVLAAIYLLWFRKGWLVKWCLVATIGISGLAPTSAMADEWRFTDLWLTKDQQGQILYNDGEFKQAAEVFESSKWKAISYFKAGNYLLAQEYFLRSDDLYSRFGAATALAHQREYVAARKAFKGILEQNPDYPGAHENLELMEAIIAQINMQSESQSNNAERQNSRELGEAPQTSEGADTQVQQDQLIQTTLSSEDILNDEEANQMWMRRVDSDLSGFLRSKFDFQLKEGRATLEIQNEK